ncbi:hypothetical protein HLV37_02345 [Eggerthellaceae bacterium zg-1084]|uniref:Uncharacterized protein n=1 Tax=Berryella wangjianweii TaxID=2734634 RepID=A0A6M8J6U9_9ACTN|nr:hypothetical protein [Berryella wangjianweii]NPD30720.1 hypothetical protein [Berryella wangjianweii]QKF07358.1 hypothetical protein HLV38_03910 [Berryella wangjianweii]
MSVRSMGSRRITRGCGAIAEVRRFELGRPLRAALLVAWGIGLAWVIQVLADGAFEAQVFAWTAHAVVDGDSEATVPGSRADGLLPEGIALPSEANHLLVGSLQVSYEWAGDAEAATSALRRSMTGQGWDALALGGAEGLAFTRQEGGMRWCVASFTQIGEKTCVLIQCIA